MFSERRFSIIVASISHDIWLGCILTLATLIGLVTVILAASRRFADEREDY